MTSLNLYSKEQIDAKQIGDPTDAESSSGSLWARIKNALSRIGTAEGNITSLQSGKANDNEVVKLTGDQTVAGTKTFSSSPIVPDSPATEHSAVAQTWAENVAYSDDTVNNLVHKEGNESINGVKTFQANYFNVLGTMNVGQNNSSVDGTIELSGKWPYIDMHYGGAENDYSTRLWNNESTSFGILVRHPVRGSEARLFITIDDNDQAVLKFVRSKPGEANLETVVATLG